MLQYKMLVLSGPAQGRDGGYSDWYDRVYIPQVMAQDGFASARRFRLAEKLTDGKAAPWAAIYDFETDDLNAMLAKMNRVMEAREVALSEHLDINSASVLIYEEMGQGG
jgi:hypothetical protein